MKLYDFDGMFDEKLKNYMSKNMQKYTEEQWEDIIPKLYQKFGNSIVASIGVTPIEYYANMSEDELVKCLRAHIKEGIPISEFLSLALDSADINAKLLPMLYGSRDEIIYAINVIGCDSIAFERYFEMLISSDIDEDIKDDIVDLLKESANQVKTTALEYYKSNIAREYMLEILSRTSMGDDVIFNILLNEFRCADENLPMRASYLASYGDERALPYLLETIEREDITFIEYQELKYAIEALGGEYSKERDFSGDEYYNLIKGSGEGDDIYSIFTNHVKNKDK